MVVEIVDPSNRLEKKIPVVHISGNQGPEWNRFTTILPQEIVYP